MSASPPHLTLSLYARALIYACATLVVFTSVYFSGTAVAKRLILLEEMCVCKQKSFVVRDEKERAVSQLGNDVFSLHTQTHTHTHAETHISLSKVQGEP